MNIGIPPTAIDGPYGSACGTLAANTADGLRVLGARGNARYGRGLGGIRWGFVHLRGSLGRRVRHPVEKVMLVGGSAAVR